MDVIKCYFNNSLTITYSKTEPRIINGQKVKYESNTLKTIIENHFKNRPADIVKVNYDIPFNILENQYNQVYSIIKKAIEEGKDEVHFTCEVTHEKLCNLCKIEWFIPRYSHINICDDCNDCFFD